MSAEQNSIIDMSTYAKRLWRYRLKALPALLVALAIGIPWTFLAPSSWEAKSGVTAEVPQAASEADATQQSLLIPELVSADQFVAQQSAEVAEIVAAKQSAPASALKAAIEIQASGGVGLSFTATGESAEAAAALANDYAAAFITVVNARRATSQPALQFSYVQSVVAAAEVAEAKSGKLPRLLISAGFAALAWVGLAAVLDGLRQSRQKRPTD